MYKERKSTEICTVPYIPIYGIIQKEKKKVIRSRQHDQPTDGVFETDAFEEWMLAVSPPASPFRTLPASPAGGLFDPLWLPCSSSLADLGTRISFFPLAL